MQSQVPQFYPINSLSFQDIREENYLYIDKTDHVYKMTNSGLRYVFLSRPRRFGKSLLVSTLKAYFEGKKDLFKGLKIEGLENEWIEYPVLHFDFCNVNDIVNREDLIKELNERIQRYEDIYGHIEGGIKPGTRLTKLISQVYKQTGKHVVVLIDEYDAPLLDVLNKDILEDVRGVMKNFYSALKESFSYLKFVFLTGITKFSQLSFFSALNNITNISMMDEYASICGITEDEMLGSLKLGIGSLAKKQGYSYSEAVDKLKSQYDGYHFSKVSPDIYNPYSLLSALSQEEIKNYWFTTGTPTFLIEILKKYDVTPNNIGERYAGEDEFDVPTETMIDELPLLYQAGYLTIKGYNEKEKEFFLDIPNKEVRVGLMDNLLPQYVAPNKVNEARRIIRDLSRAIREERIDDALKGLKTFLSTIPQTDNTDYEGHYQSILYTVLYILGSYQQDVEVHTPRGRVDMVLRTWTHLYLFELKFNKSAREAIEQINIKNYAERFSLTGLPIVKIGINFSSETRTISDWIIEE